MWMSAAGMLLHVPHSAASSERSKGPSCVAGHAQWSARSDPSSAGPAVPSPLQPSTHPVTCTITIQHMYVRTYVRMQASGAKVPLYKNIL